MVTTRRKVVSCVGNYPPEEDIASRNHHDHNNLPLHHQCDRKDDERKYDIKRKYFCWNKTLLKWNVPIASISSVFAMASCFLSCCLIVSIISTYSYQMKKKRWGKSKAFAQRLGWGNLHSNPLPIVVEILTPLPQGSARSNGTSYDRLDRKNNNLSLKKFKILQGFQTQGKIDVEIKIHDMMSSRDYDKTRNEKFISGDCIQQFNWQLESYPSCNSIHEISLAHDHDSAKLVNGGFWRDIWEVDHVDGTNQILKTLR